ncbi:formimidoylglutamase [Endozoicomonas sp.]|nr:formimidoylglutamase [Endozoicomonas sp.]
MYQLPDSNIWTGRRDSEDGEAGIRWYQHIQLLDMNDSSLPEKGAVIIGFCSDEGVRRNKGRTGAKNGPQHIRRSLAGQAWHKNSLPLFDAGNILCTDQNLEVAQDALTNQLVRLLETNFFPVVLGGGHEVALASGRAVYHNTQKQKTVTGIINFDAHFDLRLPSPKGSSGTPFYQLSQECLANNDAFHYLCMGVAETANTHALFQRAAASGVTWVMDSDIHWSNLDANLKTIDQFMAGCDQLYLTIDLDVLPAATMPGVSAPAARGVPLDILELLITRIITNHQQGAAQVRLADLAECNPAFDIDHRSGKVAARLVNLLLNIAV